jgi:hypothetical protein
MSVDGTSKREAPRAYAQAPIVSASGCSLGPPAPTGSPFSCFIQAGCIPTPFSSKPTPSPAEGRRFQSPIVFRHERSRNAFRARRASAAWPIACATSPSRTRPICGRSSRRASPPATRRCRERSRASWRAASAPTTPWSRRARSPALTTISRRASPTSVCPSPIGGARERRTRSKRLFVEERRRLKIVPNGFGEKPVMKLMFGALICAAERSRGLRFTEFELRQLTALRKELDEEYIRLQSRRRHGHPNRAFPANRHLDP